MRTKFITPYKICLLALLQKFCSSHWEPTFAQKALYFLIHKLAANNDYQELTILELMTELEELGDEVVTLEEMLREKLEEIRCPNDLYDLFSVAKNLLHADEAPAHNNRHPNEGHLLLHRRSVFGVFVRRAWLEFQKMPMEKIASLFSAFIAYRSAMFASEEANESKAISDASLLEEEKEGGVLQEIMERYHMPSENIIARSDAEHFLDYQVSLLEKSSGIIPPRELQQKLNEIQHQIPTLFKVYYVSCLNCLRSGEVESAFENLHKFFDYCHVNQKKTLYQYALLNLAILHSRFNHKQQALWAVREAVSIARENQDQECLSYALSWLHRLNKSRVHDESTIETSEQQMLESLVGQTKELNLLYLQSLSELTKAKQALQTGASPSEIFESLLRSTSINTRYSLEGIIGTSQLLAASVWDLYGSSVLSTLYTQLQLAYHPNETVPEDIAIGHCKLAYQQAMFGNYDQALSILHNASKEVAVKGFQVLPWVQCMGQILHQRALYTEELSNARAVSSTLAAACQDDELLRMDVAFRKALYLAKKGQLNESLDMIWALVKECFRHNSTTSLMSVTYLLKLAEIHMESDVPISALPLILGGLTLSERFHIHASFWLANARLAELLLQFNLPRQALETIEGIMPRVLAHGSLHLQSTVHFVHAKCILACIAEESQSEHAATRFSSVLPPLEYALAGFRRLNALEEMLSVLYYQARVFDHLGFSTERNQAAKQYRLLVEQRSKSRMESPLSNFYYYSNEIAS
ncbi:uncharacterized protein VTP21DRAFT_6638 [Calcarisporiella thermophila]|uniref:uncharacterized protein n=1 Tax=Calcarisporiella thermophila TaxID=911321 RepID=UPI003742DCEC